MKNKTKPTQQVSNCVHEGSGIELNFVVFVFPGKLKSGSDSRTLSAAKHESNPTY